MIKKRITYENPFTNQQVTEEHYFHISKADLVEMEMSEHGVKYTAQDGEELTGMRAKIQRIIDSEDGKAIMTELKDIIRRAYGKKDGDRFVKSPEIADTFMGSEAFSQLFFELCTDAKAASDFIAGVVPGNLEQIAAEVAAQAATQSPTAAGDVTRKEVFEGTGAPAETETPSATISGDEARRVAVAEGHPSDTAAQTPPTAPTSPNRPPAAAVPSSSPSAPPEPFPAAAPDRAREIANATPENPVMLTPNELATLDSDDFKSGIATGRYKLS